MSGKSKGKSWHSSVSKKYVPKIISHVVRENRVLKRAGQSVVKYRRKPMNTVHSGGGKVRRGTYVRPTYAKISPKSIAAIKVYADKVRAMKGDRDALKAWFKR